MAIKTMAAAVAVCVLCAGNLLGQSGYTDEFGSPDSMENWIPMRGKWELDLRNRAYVHSRKPDDGDYAYAISRMRMVDGAINITAAATQHNEVNNGGCFGILVKYIDSDNWYAVRFGGYGSVNIRAVEDGSGRTISTGQSWRPEVGRTYTAGVVLRGERMMILLDDEIIASLEEMPFPGREGYTGLYALSAASFEKFEASAE